MTIRTMKISFYPYDMFLGWILLMLAVYMSLFAASHFFDMLAVLGFVLAVLGGFLVGQAE